MGAEAALIGTGLQAASELAGMFGGGEGTATLEAQKQIAANRREEALYDLSLQRRDTRAEGEGMLSRMRNFIAQSGAAGTASGQHAERASRAKLASRLHRIDVTKDRVKRNAATEISSAEAAIKSKEGNQFSKVAGSLLKAGGAVASDIANLPVNSTSVTDLGNAPASDISSRKNIGTSKPGGIGGF